MRQSTVITPAVTYRAIVGRVLAQYRSARKLDQSTFAGAVGVSQSTWSRIETGASSLSVDQLRRACEVLGIAPALAMQEADRAALTLSRQGVSVVTAPDEPSEKVLAFLGGAALAALLVSILARK